MTPLKLYLFRSPSLVYQGQVLNIRRRKALGIVAYVAMAKKAVSRDTLVDLFWQESDPEQARASLRTALHALTSSHPSNWLLTDKHQVSINDDIVEVDCNLFSQYLAQSRQHDHENETLCEDCFQLLLKAESLYKGDFLSGFTPVETSEFETWRSLHATIFRREYADVLSRIARYYHEQVKDVSLAITYALRHLAIDPLNEPAHRQLMRFYYETGQRTLAIQQYQTCVDILDEELATPPENETVKLYEQIRDGHLVKIATPVDTHATYNVLPTLPTLLVGRNHDLQEIKSRLGVQGQRRETVVIQGLPGVGKSTLVAQLAHDPDLMTVFPDGVLWTSLGETPDILSKLKSWASALKIEHGDSENINSLSLQINARLQDKQVLLIVDDVWHIDHSKPFRVGGRGSSILFTSRLNDVASSLASSQLDLYNLAVLNHENGLKLLEMLTPNTVREYSDASLELVQNLEGLPLAIQVAGRLLQIEERLGWGVVDLLEELRDGERLLNEVAPSDMMQQDTTTTIAALLKRSTDTLSKLTQERFALLGLFVPKPATFDLGAMNAIWDMQDPKPIARELVNRGLLEPVGGGRFQMHALLVLHAKSLLGTI